MVRKISNFYKSKPIEKLSDQDIKDFLTSLAVEKNVAASTQNQAFNALLFFFRHVLKSCFQRKNSNKKLILNFLN